MTFYPFSSEGVGADIIFCQTSSPNGTYNEIQLLELSAGSGTRTLVHQMWVLVLLLKHLDELKCIRYYLIFSSISGSFVLRFSVYSLFAAVIKSKKILITVM